MECVIKGKNPFFSLVVMVKGVPPGELECRLIGFRAGIAEEDLIGKRELNKPASKFERGFGCEDVLCMPQTTGLLGKRRHKIGMSVTERIHRNATTEINIFPVFLVPHTGTRATHRNHRGRSIVRHHVSVVPITLYC